MTDLPVTPDAVLEFWFRELKPDQWFKRSDALDATIVERFAIAHERAVAGECDGWRSSPEGRLAEILVLDQFSRHLYRADARAWAADPMALALAQELVSRGWHLALEPQQRGFALMPYMHSESRSVHERAVELFADLQNLEHELRHKAVIDRFGRYPHRNAVLGRDSSAEELEWLASHQGF